MTVPGRCREAKARGLLASGLKAAALALLLAVPLFGTPSLARGPESVAGVAEGLQDTVVNISTTQTLKGSGEKNAPSGPGPKGSPFEDLFNDFFDEQDKEGLPRKVSSLGSGFVIDPSGLIVTNNHVIEGADEIIVNFTDGSKLKVTKILGHDPKTDLALLKVEPKHPLKAVRFGDSARMRVGDWVMAIGNPFGLGGTVTVGIISATKRDINSGPYDDFLQTDAAINRGNSGGPLFNMDGEVIGVNTAIISPTGGSIGIGFAVPSNSAVQVVDQLKQFGETRRGWLGVHVQNVTGEIAKSMGLQEPVGALVASVAPGGPAAAAGLKPSDVILKFDGQPVDTMRSLPRAVASTPIGKAVDVEVQRSGEVIHLTVTVGRLPEEAEEPEAETENDDRSRAWPRRRGAGGRARSRRAARSLHRAAHRGAAQPVPHRQERRRRGDHRCRGEQPRRPEGREAGGCHRRGHPGAGQRPRGGRGEGRRGEEVGAEIGSAADLRLKGRAPLRRGAGRLSLRLHPCRSRPS